MKPTFEIIYDNKEFNQEEIDKLVSLIKANIKIDELSQGLMIMFQNQRFQFANLAFDFDNQSKIYVFVQLKKQSTILRPS